MDKNRFIFLILMISGLLTSRGAAEIMDLSGIPCEFPWEPFTTESNTTGILFEDRSTSSKPFFLDITNAPAGNFMVEIKFTMKTFKGFDQNSAIGIQIWEGLERFGKDKSKKGHFLVLYTSDGNLEIWRWNGSYYSTVSRKTRFALAPQKPQTLRVEASRTGSIKVYVKKKLQMSARVKVKVNAETPVRLCAFPGTWMELTSLEVK